MTFSYHERAAAMTPTSTFSAQQQHEQISDMNQDAEEFSEMTKKVRKLLWKYLRKGDLESVSKIFEGAFAKINDHSLQSEETCCQVKNPQSIDE